MPAIVSAIAFTAFSIKIVPANNVGIHYSPISGVKDTVLTEGIHLTLPFDTVYQLSTEVQSYYVSGVSAQTKDSQFLTSSFEIKYRVTEASALEVFKQFRTLENVKTNLLATSIQKAMELVTINYNVIEVLGDKRGEVYIGLEESLVETLKLSGVELWSVTIVDTDAGFAIEEAITQEAVAKKAVETAEQERLKAEIDTQIRVVEAQADLDKARIEAETKLIEAQAEADANKLIAESITQGLVDLKEAEARLTHGWVEVITQSDVIVGVN